MPRELPVHALAMAVLIGATAYAIVAVGPALPAYARDVTIALEALFVAVWAVMMAVRVRAHRAGRAFDARGQDRAIVWMGNGVLITGYWLGMPFAPEWLRLLALMGQCATVTAEMLGTIERPPAKPPLAYAPIALPLASALYFTIHWERYSPVLILFLLCYAVVVLQLGRILQGSVDRAYADRRAAEAALAQVAAERDARTRFLTSASHDLGQPLQAARLFFDQALRGRTAPQRRAAADKAAWAFDATEQLLRQMLDHLKLEAGAVAPQIGPVALGPLIARLAEMHEPAARLAGVELLALPTRLSARADPALVERALGNLVANAIRHAKARRVLIGARRAHGRVRLWVLDDGVGVPAAEAERLFDDFVQGSDHGDEVRGGFGLGLSSARRMAALMGGAAGLEPKWRAGAAFWLELVPAGGEA